MQIVKRYILVSLFGVTLISGCAGCGISRQTAGTAIGIGAGGLVGSLFGSGFGRVAATIGGAALGGLVGGAVGRSMDQTDYNNTGQALETVPTGQTYNWSNPDTGYQYGVTPTETYYPDDNAGQPCRNFTFDANIDGQEQPVHGTACRDDSGEWQILNN